MSLLEKFMENLVFEVQKEFWNERGRGARYRLTRVGVSFAKDKLGEGIKDRERIKAWLKESGFCGDIDFEEDNYTLKMKIKGCCLKNIRDAFFNSKINPLSCPIANIFMYSMELNTGFAPELLPIEVENGDCKITLAKMGTSDVVKG